MNLTSGDLELFAKTGVPECVVRDAGILRVTHQEAREQIGITFKSDHLEGIAFPFLDPEDGAIRDWTIRRDNPEQESDGRPIAKYVSPPGRRHLYIRASSAQLTDASCPVIFVEAPKSALAIDAARLTANRIPRPLIAATGGCWGWRCVRGKTLSPSGARVNEKGPLPDLDRIALTDRDAVIVFDSNVTTNENVQTARRAFASELTKRGARVRVVDLPQEDGVNGPDDYIGKHGAAAFWALIDNAKTTTRTTVNAGEKESQATALVRLATESGAELWHTPAGDGYITTKTNDHGEHYPLLSRAAKDYLGRLYFMKAEKSPNASALQDALNTLSGIARFDGAERDVSVRIASHDSNIYLDLCDPLWRAVEIAKDGWRVVTDPPVRFRRPRGVLPLPDPQRGGDLRDLRSFVNVASDDDFKLMVAWLLAALRGRGPYPILTFMAEQGAAKTTTTRVARRLCDPNDSDVRRPPRNVEDLMIAASNGHVVAFDNLSRLPEELSDNLSVLATGGGFAVRQLYTNSEEVIFNAQRPIILNGISQVATRGDLLDRAIVITLPPIPEDKRKDEATFWTAFHEAHPRILGALLDAVVIGLQRVADVRLERKPRMADFAIWGMATEAGCPWSQGAFLKAYTANRQDAIETMLDGDPVADAVKGIVPWSGTATDLLETLNAVVPETLTKRKDWFSKPRQVSDALRRLAPALRRTGINVVFTKQGHKRTRLIQIERLDASASSASSAGPDLLGDLADAGADDMRTQADSSAGSSAENLNVCRLADAADAADADKRLLLGRDEDEWYPPGLGGIDGKF